MHILVTGAGGMIGRKLVERLLTARTIELWPTTYDLITQLIHALRLMSP